MLYALVDRDALEQVPGVKVVGREEAEAVLTGNRPPGDSWMAPPAREGAQLGEASAVRADRRVLGGGEATELDGWVGARGLVAQPAAFIQSKFIHRDVEAALRQFLSGGEAGDTGTEDRDRAASRRTRPGS